jgi:peptidylprolyl isomerase
MLEAEDSHGHVIALKVVEITEEKVTLDANHPLAGEDLTFAIELVKIG